MADKQYRVGSLAGVTANFSSKVPIKDVTFELVSPTSQSSEWKYGEGDSIVRVAAVKAGAPDQYILQFIPDKPGTWKYEARATVAGKTISASGAIEVEAPEVVIDDKVSIGDTVLDAGKADPTSPDDYAVVPDKEKKSTWKLQIQDAEHVAMAITAMQSGGFRGQKVELTPEEKRQAISRISAKIGKLDIPDEDKQRLRDRLNAVKTELDEAAYGEIDLDEFAPPPSTVLKSISENRFGGYLVIWGSPAQKDLTGEYFTPTTDLGLDWYPTRPALYHHGLDKAIKASLIGVIDTLQKDDTGVWAEAQINKANRYWKSIQDLIAKGKLSWSSGSAINLVEKDKDGRIVRWPIVEGTVTPTPAEPRNTHVIPVKAVIPAYKALNIPTDRLGEYDDSDASGKATTGGASKSGGTQRSTQRSQRDAIAMTPEELAEFLENRERKAEEARQLAIKAKEDQDKLIADEVDKRVRDELAKLKPSLPSPRLPVPGAGKSIDSPDDDKPKVQVIGDRKHSELSAADMAYMANFYARCYASDPLGQSNLAVTARQWVNRYIRDDNRTFARELASKAFNEVKRDILPYEVLEMLPYKSLDDVSANNYIQPAIKANELDNAAQTGFGLEWVPNIWWNEFWPRVRISNPFAGTMVRIDMPSNPFFLPLEQADPTVYFAAEGTDLTQLVLTSGNTVTASKVASGKATLTAVKLAARVGFSNELMEDSIIAIIPRYRAQMIRQLQNYVDDTIVNGDTATTASTNINLIDGTPTAGTSYLAFNGLRKFALVTNTAQSIDAAGTPTLALFRKLRFTLGKQYAVDLANLVMVVDPSTYAKMLNMPEFLTWQNMGMAGSNVTGLLPNGSGDTVADKPMPVGFIDGMPVYVSAQIGLANTSGKISTTGSNNTTGTAVLFHRTRWYVGYRRDIQLDVYNLPYFSDTQQMIAYVRLGLTNFDTGSAAVLYDINVS